MVADVACITCSYNLRTLARHTTCPECGRPIEKSLKQTNLQTVDWHWLRIVDRGLCLLVPGLAMMQVAVLMFIYHSIVHNHRLMHRWIVLGMTLLMVPLIAGVWQLTRRPPRTMAMGRARLRVLLRVVCIAAALAIPMLIVSSDMAGGIRSATGLSGYIISFTKGYQHVALLLLWPLLVTCFALFLRRHTKLLESPRLYNWSDIPLGLMLSVWVIGIIGTMLLLIPPQPWLSSSIWSAVELIGLATTYAYLFVLMLQPIIFTAVLIALHLSLRKIIPEARRQQGG